MNNSVRYLHQPDAAVTQEVGFIHSGAGETLLVQTERGIEPVCKAVSCLVKPVPGDLVLVNRIGQGRPYVTAVLEREAGPDAEVNLDFKGDVTMSSPGAIELSADSTHLLNRQFKLSSQKVALASEAIEAVSQRAVLHSPQVRLFSKAVDVVAERMTRHLKTLISVVKGAEVRQAVTLTEQVEEVRLQRDRQTVLNTSKDLQMNAERIHMG